MPSYYTGGLDNECPYCHAQPGQRCINAANGNFLTGVRVHAQRSDPQAKLYTRYTRDQLAEDVVLVVDKHRLRPCHLASFRSRLAPPDEQGCILWTAGTDANGYGSLCVHGVSVKTHRIAWCLANGPMPVGLEPDHTCEVRRCCNPEHLEAVTHAENVRRRGERMVFCTSGRHRWDEQAPFATKSGKRHCRHCKNERRRNPRPPKTHCKRNHEFTPENTYQRKDGGRQCKECTRLAGLKRAEERRAA
jgi:hypothetical protein